MLSWYISFNCYIDCFLCFVCSGIEDYLQRYSEGIKRVLTTFGPVPEFSGEAAARISKVWLLWISCTTLKSVVVKMHHCYTLKWKLIPPFRRSRSWSLEIRSTSQPGEREEIRCWWVWLSWRNDALYIRYYSWMEVGIL